MPLDLIYTEKKKVQRVFFCWRRTGKKEDISSIKDWLKIIDASLTFGHGLIFQFSESIERYGG